MATEAEKWPFTPKGDQGITWVESQRPRRNTRMALPLCIRIVYCYNLLGNQIKTGLGSGRLQASDSLCIRNDEYENGALSTDACDHPSSPSLLFQESGKELIRLELSNMSFDDHFKYPVGWNSEVPTLWDFWNKKKAKSSPELDEGGRLAWSRRPSCNVVIEGFFYWENMVANMWVCNYANKSSLM